MADFFLGVDTGATKTHALIADDQGNLLGHGKAGCGNHESVGYDGVKKALSIAVSQALHMAGLNAAQISGAGFGIAGYDWPSERPDTLDAISVLGLNCPLEAANDMVVGLIAGAEKGWGVVIDAGTGTNCRGRTLEGREGYMTGMGDRFSEHGGAGDLVWAAVQVVANEWSRRGPKTRLSQELLRLTGASDLTDLLEGLTLDKYDVDSSFAPVVFKLAEAGDAVAREIITWLGVELGESVCAVVRQMGCEAEEVDVIMIGSVFNGGPLLIEPMVQTIHKTVPGARFTRLEAPPVVGGVMLGMQMAGRDFMPIRNKLIENARKIYG